MMFSLRTLDMAYSMVTNTTRNTDSTAMPTLSHGSSYAATIP